MLLANTTGARPLRRDRTRLLWLGLTALLLAGCYDPQIGNSKLGCNPSGAGAKCPDGYHCGADNACWLDGMEPVPKAPQAPFDVVASVGVGTAEVTWFPPLDDGYKPITRYTVTASPGGATAISQDPDLHTYASFTGLFPATAYSFTVTAENSIGTGPASTASAAVTTPGPPGKPTNVVATLQNGSAIVTWTAPDSGGTPILSYAVTSDPPASSATVGGNAATLFLLPPGSSYTFTIVARNAIGDGPTSDPSAPVTP